jgi:hypothetical protein
VVTIIQGTIVLAVVVANSIARRVALRNAERGSGQAPATVAGDGGTGPDQTRGGPAGPTGDLDQLQGA